MSDNDNSNLAAIAYPGFVDILSSVLIMFVFFVLIIASALYFHMIIFKSEMEAAMLNIAVAEEQSEAQSQAQQLALENESLKEELQTIKQQMELAMTESKVTVFQETAQLSKSLEQKVIMYVVRICWTGWVPKLRWCSGSCCWI